MEIKNLPTDPGYDPADQVALDVASVLVRGAAATGPWPAHVVVSSFWPDTLVAVGTAYQTADRAARPRRPEDAPASLGLLVHPALDVLDALDTAQRLGCGALHPHHSRVSAGLVDRAHALGLAVVTWTVNSPEDLDAVVEAGVDVVITDSVVDTLAHLGRI